MRDLFENDVKMYGIQTLSLRYVTNLSFENDVKMYGIQTWAKKAAVRAVFENDVKMYGIQTINSNLSPLSACLRMM